jgi:RNA polymerase sigma factor (sigma-70 family)
MLKIEEAQQLMEEFVRLKGIAHLSLENEKLFKQHQKLCVKKFKYLVTMKTSRYHSFANYEDLIQEGLVALVHAMNNYNPKLGNFFWWGHKYIDTRISRSANLHTTIRYPIKVAKLTPPYKEAEFPLMVSKDNPELDTYDEEVKNKISKTINLLDKNSKSIVDLYFGFTVPRPMSINKICKELKIPRSSCLKALKDSLSFVKDNINI